MGCESLNLALDRGRPGATDSYCSTYQKVVRGKGDATIAATTSVKQAILANEITFRCECEGWDSPRCKRK